jgi:hypothetical protein
LFLKEMMQRILIIWTGIAMAAVGAAFAGTGTMPVDPVQKDTPALFSIGIQSHSGDQTIPYTVQNRLFNNPFFAFLDKIEFDRSYRLVYVIWVAIAFSILSMLVILPFILLNRNHLENKERTDQFLKERYQETVINYLYEPEHIESNFEKIKIVASNNYNRQFLINEIIDISMNLKGETVDKLKALYFDLQLDKLTLKKLKSRKWHKKIKAFREFSVLGIRVANDEIRKSLHSKNEILRMEAQIALVRLNEKDPFHFLDNYDKAFSLWEQMNIHELIVLHNLDIPRFSKWAHSPNKSVAIFAIEMIRVMKQNEAFHEITGILEHEDPDVRKAVITALGSFKDKMATLPLINHYPKEVYGNKLAILKALQKSAFAENIFFLKGTLDNETDVELQVEAAKAIREVGETGKVELQELIHSEKYRNYQIILKHVLDKRI